MALEKMLVPKFEIWSNPPVTLAHTKAIWATPEGCLFIWDEQECFYRQG